MCVNFENSIDSTGQNAGSLLANGEPARIGGATVGLRVNHFRGRCLDGLELVNSAGHLHMTGQAVLHNVRLAVFPRSQRLGAFDNCLSAVRAKNDTHIQYEGPQLRDDRLR